MYVRKVNREITEIEDVCDLIHDMDTIRIGIICYRCKDTKISVTCLYESIVGFGKAEKMEGEEASRGLQQVLDHYGYGNHDINDGILL